MAIGKSIIRIGAMASKEWLQVRRDSRSFVLAIIGPVILVLLFGYALSVDVKNVSTLVLDQSTSSLSRQFLEEFSHNEYLKIYRYVNNYREIDELINSGEAKLAIVIPVDFEKKYRSGKQAEVQLLVDGSDSTSSMVAVGYVKGIINRYNLEMQDKEFKRIGIAKYRNSLNIETRIWYNPQLESKIFIIPGLIVIILAIISALIASLTISREWERGTMETLITTPVKSYEIVLGKLIPYVFIGIFDVMVAIMVSNFVFNIPFRGNIFELYLVSTLFLVGTTSLGIMISSITRVQVLSVQLAMVATYLPTFILSGFIFPIENMPSVVQGITYLVPAKYLMVLVKGIFTKGISAALLYGQIVFLLIFAVVVIIISIKKMKMQLPEN